MHAAFKKLPEATHALDLSQAALYVREGEMCYETVQDRSMSWHDTNKTLSL